MVRKSNLVFAFIVAILFLSVTDKVWAIGSIPLKFTENPAKDLVSYEEPSVVLNPRNLTKMHAAGVDLSALNPKETDIWNNKNIIDLSMKMDDLKIDTNKSFSYIDKIAAPIGSFRFSIRENESTGVERNFGVWISKDARSILLRKNILRKLGYKAPKTMHIQNLKVKFKGMASLEAFIKELEGSTYADSERWKVSIDEDRAILVLQDIILIESNFTFYNITTGEIPESAILHRRAMNALLIPLAVCDVRESVDGLNWHVGKVDTDQYLLDSLGADQFTTTFMDGRWILRKMSKLTRKDFEEIVEYAFYPPAVSKLLVEKLISRFNSIRRHFDLGKEKLKADILVSDKTGELVKGRLTINNWKGHASRYSFDDTESPLSSSEMRSFFRGKFNSVVLSNLVSIFNDKYLYKTDIQEEAIRQQIKAQTRQFENLFKTGKFKRIPFKTWALPTFQANIFASRDIVTGSYLGTDNSIQIADSIEILADAGVFVGAVGVPVPFLFSGGVNARFSRSYTHVKGIKSIKKALREPFRNMLVPLLKRKKGQNLQSVIDELKSSEYTDLEGDEQKEKLHEILDEVKNVLEVGESLIISNNLVFSSSINIEERIDFVKTMLSFNARRLNLWRLHLLRSDDNTIQVYKSKAATTGGGFGLRFQAYMPILSVKFDQQSGRVTTMFNSINIGPDQESDALVRGLKELRQILFSNSVELLNANKKPFYLRHNFFEKSSDNSLFFMKKTTVNIVDNIKISHPEGFDTKLLIRSAGKRNGRDYQQVTVDILNGLIGELVDSETPYSINNPGSGNPGDSFKGSSFSRVVTLELPLDGEEAQTPFTPFSTVQLQWKGWRANQAKLASITNQIKKKYGPNIFTRDLLAGTKQVQLYSVDLTLSLYEKGIKSLTTVNEKYFRYIVEKRLAIPWPKSRSHWEKKPGSRARRNVYRGKLTKIKNKLYSSYYALNSSYAHLLSPEMKSLYTTNMINITEAALPFKYFLYLIGGKENIYIKGAINGFRVGVENGEESIVSHSFGDFGSELTDGAFATLRDTLKISPGELGAYWLLRRLQ